MHHDSFESIIKEIDLRILNGAFISYAQNKEDVYINRLFSSIRNGFYVDVGCFDPVLKSTTCALYRRGWSGVNIDASKSNIDKFITERPNDLNLNIAVGSKNEIKNCI